MREISNIRIFIYPKGKVGLDIAYLLRFVGYSDIVFIDDSNAHSSIEVLKESIESEDLVLVASRKNYLPNLNIYQDIFVALIFRIALIYYGLS